MDPLQPTDRGDRFLDWVVDKFGPGAIRFYLGEQKFSRLDLFVGIGFTLAVLGHRPWWVAPGFVVFWLLVSTWIEIGNRREIERNRRYADEEDRKFAFRNSLDVREPRS